MFFKKSESKRWPACIVLTIGSLAAIGALTISKSGKKIAMNAWQKVKGMLGDGSCSGTSGSE